MIVFQADQGQLSYSDLREIAGMMNAGQVGILPTDTVYTLACSLNSKEGIERLCKLVGKKPSQANLSLICSDFEMISNYTTPFSNAIFRLMKTCLPGPYTFILNADVRKTRHWENRRKTIGVRLPGEELLLKLVEILDTPLICSSLHNYDDIAGYWSDPAEFLPQYESLVDFIVDDGIGGLEPSTVIDATGDTPELLREGKGKL